MGDRRAQHAPRAPAGTPRTGGTPPHRRGRRRFHRAPRPARGHEAASRGRRLGFLVRDPGRAGGRHVAPGSPELRTTGSRKPLSTGRGVIPFLLRLDSIAKSFGSVRALRGVSFELRAGEVHALLGENGAGKSTLIRIITGAHHPDRGGIEVDGRVVDRLTPARAHALGIACIYQQPALFADLTVAENIALRLDPPRRFRRVGWASRRTRARELLGRMGAAIHPDAEVRELSMPEQQLVEIA